MANMTVQMTEDVKEQALAILMDRAEALVNASLGPGRMTFGDSPLERGDRILRFNDMAARGVLDVLKVISPKTYNLLVRTNIKDVAEALAVVPPGG